MAACALGLMSAAALVTGSQTGVAPRVSDLAAAGQDGAVAPSPVNDAQSQRYGKLPLSFVPNRGQTSKPVRYYAHGPRFSLYLTKHKAVLALANGSLVRDGPDVTGIRETPFGWVMAGLVRMLQLLPANHPGRARFQQLLQDMAEAILTEFRKEKKIDGQEQHAQALGTDRRSTSRQGQQKHCA